MGLLDELKKLTKPYDDEDYLEEDLAEPVRAPGRAADARSYASYAEAPRSAEPVQPTRRPYVFSNQRAARQQQAADPYAQQDYGYAQQAYAQQGYAPDPYARSGYAPDPYAQQGYAAPARPQSGGAQPKLLLVHPDRFEQAADIADRIAERNAIVLNLETAPKELNVDNAWQETGFYQSWLLKMRYYGVQVHINVQPSKLRQYSCLSR